MLTRLQTVLGAVCSMMNKEGEAATQGGQSAGGQKPGVVSVCGSWAAVFKGEQMMEAHRRMA